MFSYFFSRKKEPKESGNIKSVCSVKTDGIEALYDFIEKNAGISLQKSKVLVKNHIITLCEEHHIESFYKLLEEVKRDKLLFTTLVESVTVHETYFFREKGQLVEALKKYRENDQLAILSAPSSSGEEAYSIAILALEMGLKNFHITGIDISNAIVQKAKCSIYSKRSVGFLNEELLEKYFIKENDSYRVKEHVKEYVTFKQANLFDTSSRELGKFDIIFSLNMFIYFQDDKKIEAYKQLESLKKNTNASIYLGHADVSNKLSEYIRSKN